MIAGLLATQEYSTWIYSLIIISAIGTSFLISRFSPNQLALDFSQKVKLGLGGFFGAMIGAKLPFLFNDWEGLLSGVAWFSSGKTILTGLAGGYVGVELTKRLLEIKTGTGDSFVIPVAVAIGIGRLGCFYAGCCYGMPTSVPWGVVFECVDQQARHPTQIYESLFHLGFAAIAIWMGYRRLFAGNRFKIYLVCYAAYRFLTEMIRPEERWPGGMTPYQYASLIMIAVFLWLWIKDERKSDRADEESVREQGAVQDH